VSLWTEKQGVFIRETFAYSYWKDLSLHVREVGTFLSIPGPGDTSSYIACSKVVDGNSYRETNLVL
jgi:hypothetical protein